MAIVLRQSTEEVIDVAEFVDFVEAEVDLFDRESVCAAAGRLQALANNKQLFIDSVHDSLRGLGERKIQALTPANTLLGKGRTKPFYVRANFWPQLKGQGSAAEDVLFSYHLCHDHNFSFLTANYFGPGYETDVWVYAQPESVRGEVGESVDLTFQGRLRLAPGTQIFFQHSKDVHTQFPPPEFSVSLNLVISDPEVRKRPQYIVDPQRSQIVGFPEGTISSRRVMLMRLAGVMGTADTAELLDRVASATPCSRTRELARTAILDIGRRRAAQTRFSTGDPTAVQDRQE